MPQFDCIESTKRSDLLVNVDVARRTRSHSVRMDGWHTPSGARRLRDRLAVQSDHRFHGTEIVLVRSADLADRTDRTRRTRPGNDNQKIRRKANSTVLGCIPQSIHFLDGQRDGEHLSGAQESHWQTGVSFAGPPIQANAHCSLLHDFCSDFDILDHEKLKVTDIRVYDEMPQNSAVPCRLSCSELTLTSPDGCKCACRNGYSYNITAAQCVKLPNSQRSICKTSK